MVVSYMRLDLVLPGARSLKDKRAILRSLIDKMRHDFRVSAAEVEDHDLWRNAALGVSVVSNDAAFGRMVLQKIMETVLSNPEVEVDGSFIDDLRVP